MLYMENELFCLGRDIMHFSVDANQKGDKYHNTFCVSGFSDALWWLFSIFNRSALCIDIANHWMVEQFYFFHSDHSDELDNILNSQIEDNAQMEEPIDLRIFDAKEERTNKKKMSSPLRHILKLNYHFSGEQKIFKSWKRRLPR